MFDFQKEVVLNSLDDVKLIEAVAETGMPAKLQVRDGGEYFGKYIVDGKVYKTLPVTGKCFELVIDCGADYLAAGKHYSLTLELGTSGDYRFDMASGLYYYRKPILVDFVAGDDEASTAAKIIKIINASVVESNKFVKAEVSGNNVKVVGLDQALNIHSVDKCEYGDAKDGEIDGLIDRTIFKASDLKADVGFTYTANRLEVGTADYLLKNRRLQTYYNVRMTTPMADEMPIKGAKYVQFSFMYMVPRVGLGGLSAAGQVVHSSTMHTFYVLESLADTFAGDIKKLGVEVPEINLESAHTHDKANRLPDNFPSSQDAKAAADIAANAAADAKVAERVTANETAIADHTTKIAANADAIKNKQDKQ